MNAVSNDDYLPAQLIQTSREYFKDTNVNICGTLRRAQSKIIHVKHRQRDLYTEGIVLTARSHQPFWRKWKGARRDDDICLLSVFNCEMNKSWNLIQHIMCFSSTRFIQFFLIQTTTAAEKFLIAFAWMAAFCALERTLLSHFSGTFSSYDGAFESYLPPRA